MKKTILFVAMAMLCLNFKANSQQVQPIKIGDKVPQSLWDAKFTALQGDGKQTMITLNNYKGKLVILDFWATWCSACIEGFDKVQKLQKQFPEELKVVLITNETIVKIDEFFKKRITLGQQVELTSIVKGAPLTAYFQHELIPHYAWISPDGNLLATTSSLEIKAEHIKEILAGKKSKFSMKIDIDTSRPLYSEEYLPEDKLQHYSVLLKGMLEGTGSITQLRTRNDAAVGITITNSPIQSIFEYCFRAIDRNYFPSRLKLFVADSSKLAPEKSRMEIMDWYNSNAYSFDLSVNEDKAANLYKGMLNELNHSSPYEGFVNLKKQSCFVLVPFGKENKWSYKSGDYKSIIEKDSTVLTKVPMRFLIAALNTKLSMGLPVLDETDYKGNIQITFTGKINSLDELRHELKKYGLNLKKTRRVFNEFIIRDKLNSDKS